MNNNHKSPLRFYLRGLKRVMVGKRMEENKYEYLLL